MQRLRRVPKDIAHDVRVFVIWGSAAGVMGTNIGAIAGGEPLHLVRIISFVVFATASLWAACL